jgi:hypothetical protein
VTSRLPWEEPVSRSASGKTPELRPGRRVRQRLLPHGHARAGPARRGPRQSSRQARRRRGRSGVISI